jgi:hypothetical protein
MAYPLSEPSGDPRDTADIASDIAEFSRDVALRQHLASVQILKIKSSAPRARCIAAIVRQ